MRGPPRRDQFPRTPSPQVSQRKAPTVLTPSTRVTSSAKTVGPAALLLESLELREGFALQLLEGLCCPNLAMIGINLLPNPSARRCRGLAALLPLAGTPQPARTPRSRQPPGRRACGAHPDTRGRTTSARRARPCAPEHPPRVGRTGPRVTFGERLLGARGSRPTSSGRGCAILAPWRPRTFLTRR